MDVNSNTLAEVCGPDIHSRIASFLPPNDIACTLRLVSRSTAEQFRERNVVRLSQPSPAAAFAARWSAPGACRALSYKRRLQLVCLTAASGDVGNLEVALAAAGLCPTAEVMVAAAAGGQLHVCRWLAERGCPLESRYTFGSPLAAAATGGHVEVCEWLLEQGCTWKAECVTSAARGGHPELMRALLRKAPPGPGGHVTAGDLLSAAAEGCDLGTLQELWREWGGGSGPTMITGAVAAAACSPTPDWAAKVAWLMEQGAERSAWTCAAAASCPDAVARLTLLAEGMGFPVDAAASVQAAWEGRANVVRWLLARGLRPRPMDEWQYGTVAELGHTEVLRALHAAGCELAPPESLAERACISGSVETVSWVVETCGAEALQAAGSMAFDAALGSGGLELVTWLRERGLGPGQNPWPSAAHGGCVAALELLPEWGAGVQAVHRHRGSLYLNAARRRDLHTLETLWQLGLTLARNKQETWSVIGVAIGGGEVPLRALRWLRQALGPVDWAAAARSARSVFALERWRTEVLAWVQAEAEADGSDAEDKVDKEVEEEEDEAEAEAEAEE